MCVCVTTNSYTHSKNPESIFNTYAPASGIVVGVGVVIVIHIGFHQRIKEEEEQN